MLKDKPDFQKVRLFFALLFLTCTGCGADSNIWQLLTPPAQTDTWDSNLAAGLVYYDNGDFEQALVFAERAWEQNPDSEDVAVLLGYVYMALAGLSPFEVIKKLSSMDDSGDESSEGAGEEVSEPSGGDSGSSGSDGFGLLSGIIGLSSGDFSRMGTVNTEVPELPVIEPVCAGEAREKIRRLNLAARAVDVICKFVDPEVRLEEDTRHACPPNQKAGSRRSESHFLWALAHITEAAAFHSVITYSTTRSSKSNLELRVDRFQDLDVTQPSQIPVLVTNLTSLTTTIDRVLQVDGFCSEAHPQTQLLALVNDLIAVTYAFGKMPGIPDSIKNSVNRASENILRIREQTSGVSQSVGQAQSAKADLTKQITSGLITVIDRVPPGSMTPEEVASVCGSVEDIGGGGGGTQDLPDVCG